MSKQSEQGFRDAGNGKQPDPNQTKNAEYMGGYNKGKEKQK